MATRIYKVELDIADVALTGPNHEPNHQQRHFLVDATSANQARAYIANKFVTCAIAKPREIVSLLQEGVTVETAGEVHS